MTSKPKGKGLYSNSEFVIPKTRSFVQQLLNPAWFGPVELLIVFSFICNIIFFYGDLLPLPSGMNDLRIVVQKSLLTQLGLILPPEHVSVKTLAFLAVCFWRLNYTFTIGSILDSQSKTSSWTQMCKSFDGSFVESLFSSRMVHDNWENTPLDYRSWLLFRNFANFILANDVISWLFFAAVVSNRFETLILISSGQGSFSVTGFLDQYMASLSNIDMALDIFSIAVGIFSLWAKTDAARVVGDYAWFWGDFFFLKVNQPNLVFDGVYGMAPHPMYTLGYLHYYSTSLFFRSLPCLYATLFIHACQFVFLHLFENPHIVKIYSKTANKTE